MKQYTILTFAVLIILLNSNNVIGQVGEPGDEIFSFEWLFTYDNAGNRIKRQLLSTGEEESYRRANSGPQPQNESQKDLDEFEYQNGLKANKVFVYPNPFNDQIQIEVTGDIAVRVRLYSGAGQLINETVMDGNYKSINVDNLAEGVYHVFIIKPDGTKEFRKLVKIQP
ncbi:MAG: T9SS type A sorting domain-containing protein [Sphingobacteriaceae bacterium]|nr:T9SS type A sorting domain-containing protein [Sphingobacteriaceae bacterium]